MAAPAGQAGESLAKRPIQAFNEGSSEHASSSRQLEQVLGPLPDAVGYVTRDLHKSFVVRVLDHGSNVQVVPDPQLRTPSASRGFDTLTKGATNTVGIGRPPIGHDQQWTQRLSRPANLLEQRISQVRVSGQTHGPREPEPGGNHYGKTHPSNEGAPFDTQFIGLHMHQIHLPLLHQGVMDLLTVASCTIPPRGNSSLIEVKGVDNRLNGTAVGQQGHDDHNDLRWFA